MFTPEISKCTCVSKYFFKCVLSFSFTFNIHFYRLPYPDMRLVNLVTRAFHLKNGRAPPRDEAGVKCHPALNAWSVVPSPIRSELGVNTPVV